MLNRMLFQDIRAQLSAAMKAREEVRVSVLRGLLAAFTNELVATGRKPTETLTDDEALAVIKRAARQRKDSIEQFRAGKREDLAAKEEAELKVLESYLPALISREEIEKLARAKKEELGVTDRAKAGALVGAVMKELKGRADGGEVKAVVDSLFS